MHTLVSVAYKWLRRWEPWSILPTLAPPLVKNLNYRSNDSLQYPPTPLVLKSARHSNLSVAEFKVTLSCHLAELAGKGKLKQIFLSGFHYELNSFSAMMYTLKQPLGTIITQLPFIFCSHMCANRALYESIKFALYTTCTMYKDWLPHCVCSATQLLIDSICQLYTAAHTLHIP